MNTRFRAISTSLATIILVAGSASAAFAQSPATSEAPAGSPAAPAGSQTAVELTLAHSYTEVQPQHACGAQVIADAAAAANVGLAVTIFGDSQLGGDADRITSVASGDIDLDIQGASALSSLYPPMSVVDGAFVFDDAEHLKRFFTDEASTPLKDGFLATTGVRVLGAWSAGARQFTANKPIRTPEDLQGLRMRFPPSPQFLMNAAAMGADPVEVAFEELYLALQQGTVDGQENPINNIVARSIHEVQDYISMSSHQLNSNLVVINEATWQSLSAEQQAALAAGVAAAMDQVPDCVAEFETQTLEDWRANNTIQIVEDVDREAFRTKAEAYLRENFTAEQVLVLEAIRSVAE